MESETETSDLVVAVFVIGKLLLLSPAIVAVFAWILTSALLLLTFVVALVLSAVGVV